MTTSSVFVCPPILFVIFNRPHTAEKVMQTIRRQRPARLYVAADGPRTFPADESRACELARSVAVSVDWPCQVFTLFRRENLGCKRAVASAIDWFFAHEEEGIILEDDVVATSSFFQLCSELLEQYRDDTRVGMISGTNFQQADASQKPSYYFSHLYQIWGWATWKRAWKQYDHSMSQWPDFKSQDGFARLGLSRSFENYYSPIFDAVAAGKIDSWAYQWMFTGLSTNTFAVMPSVNMVSNIGFGPHATHTKKKNDWKANMRVADIDFPLCHPLFFNVRHDIDLLTVKRVRSPWYRRVAKRLVRSVLCNELQVR